MKLLIVDDEKIAIEGILANIRFEDYGIEEVETANSMEQAKTIIERGGVDIVMCDIEMPNGSGLELFEWINSYAPDIVKLILSCHTEFHFAQAAVSLDCRQYITKPATPEVLAKAVTDAIEQVEKRNTDRKIRKFGEEYVNKMAGVKGDEISAAEQVHQYITEHIEEELSVEELARIQVQASGTCSGVMEVRLAKSAETVCCIPVSLRGILQKDASWFGGAVAKDVKGSSTQALYFMYRGTGAMNFHAFLLS